jgi:hypothetical protein
MLAHIVLFTPRSDLSAGDRQRLADALSEALASIPSIRRCRVGRRVKFGVGYEETIEDHYEYVAILDFDDAAGLQAYLIAPAHEELSRQFYATVETNVAYDYELLEGAAGIAVLGSS